MTRVLPITMIIIAACASIVYFCTGDIRRGIYWLCAAGINASVTF